MQDNLTHRSFYRLARRAVLGIAVVVLSAIPAAADQWNKKTTVTFNEPVEVPGKALPAGTYVFQLLDSQSDRDIVQIWNKDQNQLIDTVMAVPDYRLKTAGKTVMTFEERASSTPEAVKAWFYPGDNFGFQFVYPHDQATRIAKRTNQNVLATDNEMAKNMTTPIQSKDGTSVQQLKRAKITGVNPQGQPVDIFVIIQRAPQD